MNSLREDLISTIGKYMEIDKDALEVSLSREDEGVALVANIPVINVKRQPDSVKPFRPKVLDLLNKLMHIHLDHFLNAILRSQLDHIGCDLYLWFS